MVQMAVYLNKYSFYKHPHTTPFCTKTNPRENRLFATRWTIVSKKGTHNVKFLTANWTKKTIIPHARTWSTAHNARTLTITKASGCGACNA